MTARTIRRTKATETAMTASTATAVLDVRDLFVRYHARHATIQALDGACLTVNRGEIVALVGESGSGKSTLGQAVLGLLPASARRSGGDLLIDGQSIFALRAPGLRGLRRSRLGLILQDAAGSLDPTRRVARQIEDNLPAAERSDRAKILSVLERVRLPDVERVARSYPHQLSGGMAQRVAIAITLARSPGLIVADEPTAALDTEIKHEILRLLVDVCRDANASLLLLTHDILSISRYCTRIAVMYGGRVVEAGEPASVLDRPRHPYTRGLLGAMPGYEGAGGALQPIAGAPPVLTESAASCAFAPRCAFVVERCTTERPEPMAGFGGVLCHRVAEIDGIPFPSGGSEVVK
jgi:oligopeptide/dipeptide ABC transporter ATP-binding protein